MYTIVFLAHSFYEEEGSVTFILVGKKREISQRIERL
jgi:hypothetical protein